MATAAADFYSAIPALGDFAEAVKPEAYRPLPDDWIVGFSDVAGSTQAVAAGRYKAVNMVGAGVIAAVSNALARRAFPFVFGGDGASFAVAATDGPAAAEALRAMAVFAREELQLELRVAMVAVAEIRAAGRDIRVARYSASPYCAYAMFSGGGLSWFETRAKRGECALEPAAPGARPDLSGLSCRWGVAPAKHGVILSIIVAPRGEDPRFPELVDEVVRTALAAADGGRPITLDSLGAGSPVAAISLEGAVLALPGASRFKSRLVAARNYVIAGIFNALRLRVGKLDMGAYVAEVAANTDFRKFDDGLRLTLDCSPAFADALETRLAAAADFADFGAFRQEAAQLTCFVPAITDRGHMHFVDGAGGGYTMAAKAMKARQAARLG